MKNKFIEKFKNNKGDSTGAEGLMFVAGVLFVLAVFGFSLNLFDLQYQRYVVKRELLNASRLYATRWVEFYKKPDCDGAYEVCSWPNVASSELARDIGDIMKLTVEQGNLNSATLNVSKVKNQSGCGRASTLLCVQATKGGGVTINGADWSVVRTIDYGETVWASIDVTYQWKRTLKTSQRNGGYRMSNKFATERFKNSENIIGS